MTALGPGEIRARLRPWLVLGVALLRLASGLCLAWPLAALVSATGIGLRVEGDRALFEGGGYLLLEVLRLEGSELAAVARGLLPVLGLGLGLTAACNAALLVGLNLRERLTSKEWLARSLGAVPPLLALGAATFVGQAVLIVAALLIAGTVPELLSKPLVTSLGQAAVWLVAALLIAALGGFSDLVKASLVRHQTSLGAGLSRAFACWRQRPISASFGWFPYALAFLTAALLAALLTDWLDVSRAGGLRVAAVFLLHQLVIVVSVAARAAWFSRALRLVAVESGP